MTQNLALDIIVGNDGSSNIKASDSNVAEDWTTSSDYPPTSTMQFATSAATETDANGTLSMDLGLWVVATPMKAQSVNNITSVSALPNVGLVDVSDTNKFQPTYTASIGSWTYANGKIASSTLVAVNCNEWRDNICQSGTYDAHYLMGNYYQYNAVTAGTGATVALSSSASYNICPKGWTLPNIDGSAASAGLLYLLGRYNITNHVTGTALIDDRIYSVFEEPLAFIYGGRFVFADNRLNDAGYGGYYGTKRIFGMVTNAAILMFTPSMLEMSNASRIPGYNIRCVNDPRI